MVEDNKRKTGINISVSNGEIARIDKRAKELGFRNRSNYVCSLIEKDLWST